MKKIMTIGSGMQDIFAQYDNVELLNLHTKAEDLAYVCMRAGRKIEVQKLISFLNIITKAMTESVKRDKLKRAKEKILMNKNSL